MQPVTATTATTRVLRRHIPPAAASTMPPPPPSPSNGDAPPLPRPPELPLPSALVPPKKRRVLRTPPKATIPLPPPPPPPLPPPVPVALPGAPTTPLLQADHAESPLFSAQKPSPPPPAQKPSSPPLPPPPAENLSSPPPPPPPAEKPSSPPPPPPPAEKPSSLPPPPPLAKKPSSSPPPPPPSAVQNPSLPPPPLSTADEKPSALPPTDAAAEPTPSTKPRKITRKVRKIIKRVPKGTIAATNAAAESASAAAGALQPRKGHAPDKSSRNAAADEVVQKEQSFGKNTIHQKPSTTCNPIAVCETLLGKGETAVCETLLGKGMVGGGTLASGQSMDIGGEHEVEKKLGSRGEDRAEVVMSERQRRRMTEVFVGGLNRDAKEEDVRVALSVAGEITEVRMIMDATRKKNKGYCFVRYRESAQARKAIAQFSNAKICGQQCRVAALDGNDKIFLGNIDKKWKKEDIMKLLQKIGVENIDVVTVLADSNNPGYNRGFAFLELETYRDAQIAYRKLSRKDVFGKGLNIRVDWAEPLNGPDEKQMQKVNIRVSLAKSVQKGKKNMEDRKFCISEKDKTKTAKCERILGPSSLHILPSSSRVVPVTGDKKSSPTHGLVHVLRELAPWRREHTVSGSLTQNYPHILSGEKRPFSALGIDTHCMSRNPHGGHERNTYATSTSSYSVSPPAITGYSPPYHHESRRYLLDSHSDSVLSEPWGGIRMSQAAKPVFANQGCHMIAGTNRNVDCS